MEYFCPREDFCYYPRGWGVRWQVCEVYFGAGKNIVYFYYFFRAVVAFSLVDAPLSTTAFDRDKRRVEYYFVWSVFEEVFKCLFGQSSCVREVGGFLSVGLYDVPIGFYSVVEWEWCYLETGEFYRVKRLREYWDGVLRFRSYPFAFERGIKFVCFFVPPGGV